MARLEESTRRGLLRTGTLGAGVLLIAALLVIVNYFGGKYYKRFDWTETRLYSLSEKSKNVLADLDKDVEVLVFLLPQDELYEPTRELLRRYEAASPRVRVRILDSEKNPVEAEALVRKYEITAASVVVASGGDKRVIASSELAEMDFSAMQMGEGSPRVGAFKGEQAVTSAILQLAEGRKPKVLVTTGHGEARLDDVGARGLSTAQQLLGRDNFEIEEWSPLGKPLVPADTDLLVVAGPTGSFVPPELDILGRYLAGGGRMLVLLDPTLGGAGLVDTGLGRWLAGFGVKVGEDIVVDPGNTLPFFGAESFFANRFGDQPIVRPLAEGNLPVLFALARSVGEGAAGGFTVTNLLETTEAGWGETNLGALEQVAKDAADVAGPVPVGVAVESAGAEAAPATAEGGPKKMRLVVFGDSDFAANQLLQANVGNTVLLTNALNWLVEREALLGIPPKKTEQVHLNLTGAQLRGVVLLAVLGLPVLAAATGIWIALRRRR
ncbi:MAG TPA: GldG family protein [Thermoanaerobaculia bacterium]|nr:GldG family protein [Thermoanaerobaculia bacterium]